MIAWRNLLFGALASDTADESLGVHKFEVAFEDFDELFISNGAKL